MKVRIRVITMTKYSELSKEQLVEMLNTKDNDEFIFEKCLYKAIRSGGDGCTNEAVVEWGYCKKHSRTVQAKNAQLRWNAAVNKEKQETVEEKQEEVTKEKRETVNEKREIVKEKQEEVVVKPKKKRILKIKPNKWGRFEDPETKILFNPVDKQAFATQGKNGTIHPLTEKDIKECIARGYHYTIIDDDDEEDEDSELSDSDEGSDYDSDDEF